VNDTNSIFEMDKNDFNELATALITAYSSKYYEELEDIKKYTQKEDIKKYTQKEDIKKIQKREFEMTEIRGTREVREK